VLSAKAALAGNPDIATDRHPEVLQALAALHAAESDLQRTVVVAPTDGVVSQTDRLQQGQYVTPSAAVVSLVATGESWIEANYKETELTHMAPGQPVEVTIDTYWDRPLAGEVASIGAGTGAEFALLPAQNATGNWVKVVQRVPVRIALDEGQKLPKLRSGMSASVEVDTGHTRGLPDFVTGALAAVGLGGETAAAATGDE
jgi:membrane fusion protein, multidrug efflux system